ncbi:hypothetical protein [Actinomycetospora flava]|uniref:Uncharacterized protein n=1 Tax=Actinomycetospora flava TaxID=3129232 RepID=A0ABU8LZM6_9PSEU
MTACPPRPGGARRVELATDDGRPVVLERSGGPAMASGSRVAYMVNVDGRWVGWVFDERPWLGHRHGARSWSAAWREHDDTAARWRGEGYGTRAAALAALLDASGTA